MGIGRMVLEELPVVQQQYLLDLEASTEADRKAAIPVYWCDESGEVFFITDFILRDNKRFEKTAPTGLYRGGALLRLLTREGQIVIYDERFKWLRLIGGIARFNEGEDLTKTAVREAIVEELAVLADGEKVRLVPQGMSQMIKSTAIESWRIDIPEIRETGIIREVTYLFNDANKAFEVIIEWDISGEKNLIILHSEDWFKGGSTGFIPFVLDEAGNMVGLYDGRHGYVPMPIGKFHPTLEATMAL
jgi:hypothetical protein